MFSGIALAIARGVIRPALQLIITRLLDYTGGYYNALKLNEPTNKLSKKRIWYDSIDSPIYRFRQSGANNRVNIV